MRIVPIVYINIHVPKNAGQTFNSILRRRFGDRLVTSPSPYHGAIMSEDEKRRFVQQHPRARCFTGHTLRYPAPPSLDRQYRYLTFLREPVERLVSLYAYERKLETGRQHSSQGPIESWIEQRLAEDNALTNYQTFHILGTHDPAQVSLSAAQQRLEEYFFVGITEQFNDSLLLLNQSAGFSKYDLYYRHINVTGSKTKHPISDQVRQRLVDLNSIDLELHQWARERLQAALNRRNPASLAAQRAALAQVLRGSAADNVASYRLRRWLRGIVE